MIAKFYEYQQKASIYYAYHTIQRYKILYLSLKQSPGCKLQTRV
jgi:hypothetical protein